jgi:carbamoyltransferase
VWTWDQQEPFGVNVPDENPSGFGVFDLPLRLPGQYFDKETNLHYNYFRDYDPIEPACDDGGLAVGAALFAYHNIADRALSPRARQPGAFEAYLGPRASSLTAGELRSRYPMLDVAEPEDAATEAGGLLADDAVIGWFEGRSEAGPRALGHRSILADPRRVENWARVNRIKGREGWRPFAPIVLEDELTRWFDGAPAASPYMLFNARVKSDRIPAVTHADGTARVQTVTAKDGGFHRVLTRFAALTGVPVLLNTSFNGPAEPIIETADQAVRFLMASALDALYVDGVRLRRR